MRSLDRAPSAWAWWRWRRIQPSPHCPVCSRSRWRTRAWDSRSCGSTGPPAGNRQERFAYSRGVQPIEATGLLWVAAFPSRNADRGRSPRTYRFPVCSPAGPRLASIRRHEDPDFATPDEGTPRRDQPASAHPEEHSQSLRLVDGPCPCPRPVAPLPYRGRERPRREAPAPGRPADRHVTDPAVRQAERPAGARGGDGVARGRGRPRHILLGHRSRRPDELTTPRIDDRAHGRRREECFPETFVVHQRICQGENRRAAERAVTFRRALVSQTSLQLRGAGVYAPGSKGDLEAFHRRHRSVDTRARVATIAFRHRDARAGFPRERLLEQHATVPVMDHRPAIHLDSRGCEMVGGRFVSP